MPPSVFAAAESYLTPLGRQAFMRTGSEFYGSEAGGRFVDLDDFVP